MLSTKTTYFEDGLGHTLLWGWAPVKRRLLCSLTQMRQPIWLLRNFPREISNRRLPTGIPLHQNPNDDLKLSLSWPLQDRGNFSIEINPSITCAARIKREEKSQTRFNAIEEQKTLNRMGDCCEMIDWINFLKSFLQRNKPTKHTRNIYCFVFLLNRRGRMVTEKRKEKPKSLLSGMCFVVMDWTDRNGRTEHEKSQGKCVRPFETGMAHSNRPNSHQKAIKFPEKLVSSSIFERKKEKRKQKQNYAVDR